jgi:hypothetical protein
MKKLFNLTSSPFVLSQKELDLIEMSMNEDVDLKEGPASESRSGSDTSRPGLPSSLESPPVPWMTPRQRHRATHTSNPPIGENSTKTGIEIITDRSLERGASAAPIGDPSGRIQESPLPRTDTSSPGLLKEIKTSQDIHLLLVRRHGDVIELARATQRIPANLMVLPQVQLSKETILVHPVPRVCISFSPLAKEDSLLSFPIHVQESLFPGFHGHTDVVGRRAHLKELVHHDEDPLRVSSSPGSGENFCVFVFP